VKEQGVNKGKQGSSEMKQKGNEAKKHQKNKIKMELGQAKSWPHLYFASGCY
jgi:hypothetical protein